MYIEVRVKPGSKRDHITESEGPAGSPLLTVELKAQAEGGKANAALVKLLARHFGVSQAAIRIKRGGASRLKLLEVTSPKLSPL
jgi:hypothetical protein